MIDPNDFNINDETIKKMGLRLSDKQVSAQIAPEARVFDYPHLDNVFVMESDLYGNKVPKGSCFLAFHGNHGLVGKLLSIDALSKASPAEIDHITKNNT